MIIYSDVLTKSILLTWLDGVLDDAPIALKINDSLELLFIVVSNGQERTLKMGVISHVDDEQVDPETNEQQH
jgi:hypothetical protein